VAVVDLAHGALYAASTSSDSTLRVWYRPALNSAWTCVQTIARAPKMFEAVAIARVPSPASASSHERVIVAAGGVDGGIHLFVQQHDAQAQMQTQTQTQEQFKQLVVLEGHQDWIRCLSFTTTDSHTLLLASASQDNRVRLWSIAPLQGSQMENLLGGVSSTSSRISSKGHVVDLYFGTPEVHKFVVLLDAVLAAHEDWVYSVAWSPRVRDAETKAVLQPMRLLTASMDRTMIVWEPAGGYLAIVFSYFYFYFYFIIIFILLFYYYFIYFYFYF
jgi:elongator complex protein 2